MKINERTIPALIILLLFLATTLTAQVQVSEEPMHHKVFQNKYIRLLDVWLQPGDTTQYHIHATPSVFVILSQTVTAWQKKGEEWVTDHSPKGKVWYRSFAPDILVHRVCNLDTLPFHVNDIEILSAYNTSNSSANNPLPFIILFENEKAVAYQVTAKNFNPQIIKNRGPIVAELVTGDSVVFNDVLKNKKIGIKAGKYMYIEPGTSFYFTTVAKAEINMVLFEIK